MVVEAWHDEYGNRSTQGLKKIQFLPFCIIYVKGVAVVVLVLVLVLLFSYALLIVPLGVFPWEIPVAFSRGKPAVTELRYPALIIPNVGGISA